MARSSTKWEVPRYTAAHPRRHRAGAADPSGPDPGERTFSARALRALAMLCVGSVAIGILVLWRSTPSAGPPAEVGIEAGVWVPAFLETNWGHGSERGDGGPDDRDAGEFDAGRESAGPGAEILRQHRGTCVYVRSGPESAPVRGGSP
jgi:hypothetical protein